MFANGPQWTNAGWPSSVCTRFGLIVSFRRTLIAPAARNRAALDPEDRPERRLADAEHGALADVAEPLRQRDRGGRLPLARLRRRDRRDVDQLPVRPGGEPIEDGEVDLRLVAAVELDLLVE